MDNTQNIISFCTGYGGIELGLRRTGFLMRTVAYVEIEAFACANLAAKIEESKLDAAPIWTDIKTFNGQPFCGKVHGITGGYPCQPFSHAGQRQGTEDPRHLWPHIEQHIRTIRPVWCFFENVSGHLSLGFKEVFKSFRDMGYSVEAGLFTAAEVGAPHKRERLFILGYASDRIRWQKCQRGVDVERDALAESEWQQDTNGFAKAGSELADTELQGLHKGEINQKRQIARQSETKWPARPGQPPHEWEEPRTVEPGMGRTVDGFASRVDELRLLGNGVVPQCAEKAFMTLWEKASSDVSIALNKQ